jgi:single-strand DNA-binding protein
VTWDRLAEICGQFLGKGQQVAIEGRIQTRTWDDERGARHWKTEIVASNVEMLSGRKKKDYQAQSAAEALEGTAESASALDDETEFSPSEGSPADPLPVEAAA